MGGEAGKGMAESGIVKVGSGENRKNYTTLHNILQLKKGKEAENKKGWELG